MSVTIGTTFDETLVVLRALESDGEPDAAQLAKYIDKKLRQVYPYQYEWHMMPNPNVPSLEEAIRKDEAWQSPS